MYYYNRHRTVRTVRTIEKDDLRMAELTTSAHNSMMECFESIIFIFAIGNIIIALKCQSIGNRLVQIVILHALTLT